MEGNNNNSNSNLINLLLEGCSLAKRMESELLVSWPPPSQNDLYQKCDEIVAVFNMAKEHLSSMHSPFLIGHHHQPEPTTVVGKGKEVAETSAKAADSGGKYKQKAMMVAGGSSSSTAHQRTPRRSSRNEDEEGNKRVRVSAPQIGNTEMPPEDGYTWRKYGQKEILNAKFPRSYYRCTHQKLYNCPAKKQVQRLDNDPQTFDILYRGDHTCHNSTTAPSQALHPITTVGFSFNWLPTVGFSSQPSSSEGAPTLFMDPNNLLQQQLYSVSNSSNTTVLLGDLNHAQTMNTVGSHDGRDQAVDFLTNQPLIDWTEVFNSGSSSSANSMDMIIFPPADDNNKD